MMLLQRVRVAENGWKTSYQMGRRGCSEKQNLPSILQRERIRQLRKDMLVSYQEYRITVNQGGTADILFVLGKRYFC